MGQANTKAAPPVQHVPIEPKKAKLPRFKNVGGKDIEPPFPFRGDEGKLDKLRSICEQIDYDLREEWTLLYFSDRDGKSFNRFCTHSLNQGPNMVFIKAEDGHVFGGFASEAWKKPNPAWYGSSKCFVFQIHPEFNIFRASGYNDHFMYLNAGAESLPNGVGMGGQHNFFGWCLTSDFDHGHSNGPCATYESPILSSTRNFKTDVIEVWSCKLPVEEGDANKNKEEDEEGSDDEISDEEDWKDKTKGMTMEQVAILKKLRESKRKTKKSVLRHENNPDKVIMDLLGKTGQYHEGAIEPLEEQLGPGEKKKIKLNDIGFKM